MIINNPAAGRNAEAIFTVLSTELSALASRVDLSAATQPGQGGLRVLELASGPGQHVELFAGRLPAVRWQPSEPQAELRASIDERVVEAGLDNVAPALALDVRDSWPRGPFHLVMAVNLVHISPWEATEALVAGAAAGLAEGGTLFLYGPYSRSGEHNSQGNIDFDADLRVRDARWGIRDLEDVAELGRAAGLHRMRTVEMPANNLCLLLSAH